MSSELKINHRYPQDVKRIMNAMNCTEQEAIYMWDEYSDSLHAGWMGLPKLDSTIRQLCKPYIDGALSNTKITALEKELKNLGKLIEKNSIEEVRLHSENAALREALKPLLEAVIEDCGNGEGWDDDVAVGGGPDGDMALTFGHIRKAEKALKGGE